MALFARKQAAVGGEAAEGRAGGLRSRALKIDVPTDKQDRALTSKVGIVAVVGFGLGILWPRLLQLPIGPDVPSGNGPNRIATTSSASGSPTSSADPAVVAGDADPGSATSAAPGGEDEDGGKGQTVVVGEGRVESCGKKEKECGKVSFDKTAKARLAELARCPAAIGLEGKMSLGIVLNFEKNEVTVEGEKKKSGLPSDTVRGVVSCAIKELKGVELEKIPHQHAKYALVYDLEFYPRGQAPVASGQDKGGDDAAAEDKTIGRATVAWEKALVRESPEEGKIVARLPQGTRVKLLEEKGDWFRIESSKGKGWVYRQAIGK